jgi:hypothetical protein
MLRISEVKVSPSIPKQAPPRARNAGASTAHGDSTSPNRATISVKVVP